MGGPRGQPAPRAISFGGFVIDCAGRRLLDGQTPVELRRKSWRVLRYLAERPGRLVSREELFDTFWADTAVTPQTLTNVIREIRVALHDDSRRPDWLETVHAEGYRFIGETHTAAAPHGSALPEREPFVGRDAEIELLEEDWRAAAGGSRRIAFLCGDAGIGKTTLLRRFLADVAPTVRIAQGQCFEHHGPSEPYMPVLEAIEGLARAMGEDEAAVMLRRFAPTWWVQMPWLCEPEERARVEQTIRGTTSMRMLREGAVFLETVAERNGLILVLEDLHWADPATIDLVGALAGRAAPARLLVLATLRREPSGAAEASVKALCSRRRARRNMLQPLSIGAIESYLGQILGDDRSARLLAPRVEQQSGGNPLYLRSVTARLAVRRFESGDDTRLDVELPQDVRDLTRDSLRALPTETQRVLEAAAVAGVAFLDREVAAGAALPLAIVETICRDLARDGRFIAELSEVTLPDGECAQRFGFTHDLYRRVVYDEIAPGRRRDLHARIAVAIETLYDGRRDEVAARLAAHFEYAELRAGRLENLRRAAGNAQRRFAYREAVAYLSSAIAILDAAGETAPLKGELLALRGSVRVLAEGYSGPQVLVSFAEAERLSRGAHRVRSRLIALIGLAVYHLTTANYAEARGWTEELTNAARDLPRFASVAYCLSGYAAGSMGDFHRARALLEESLALEAEPGIPLFFDVHRMSRSMLANVLSVMGDDERARAESERALADSERFGAPSDIAHSALLAAEAAVLRGDEEMARRASALARHVSEENVFPTFTEMARLYAAASARDEPAEPRVAVMRDSLERRRALGDRWNESLFLAQLAEILCAAGRVDEAEEAAHEGLEFARRTGERHHESGLLRILGECATVRASGAEGSDYLRQAIAVAEAQGAETLRRRATRSLERARG